MGTLGATNWPVGVLLGETEDILWIWCTYTGEEWLVLVLLVLLVLLPPGVGEVVIFNEDEEDDEDEDGDKEKEVLLDLVWLLAWSLFKIKRLNDWMNERMNQMIYKICL